MQGRSIGRYVVGPEIASGGMASVHLARMLGKGGFGKTVAIKRLHPQYARDAEFVTLFQDEARVTSALTHANIVMTLDVLEEDDELCLVMEYVHGVSLSQIQQRMRPQAPLPLRISVGIIAAMLDGLHAAHEATDENGEPLDIIHRDVSPQNVLVSFQGVAKLADFGIAKAAGRVRSTGDGSVMGKIGYMAPEQLLGVAMTAQTDVYSAGVVLWEAITRRRLIDFSTTAENLRAILELEIDAPSKVTADVPRALDDVVMRAVDRTPSNRFASAKEMGTALRRATDAAHAAEIGDWLRAERPQLFELRERSLVALQRAIGASSAPAIRVATAEEESAPKSADEVETVSERRIDRRAVTSSNSSSDSSYSTEADLPPPRRRWLLPTFASALALGTAGVIALVLSTRASPAPALAATPTTSAAPPSSSAPPAPSSVPTAETASSAPAVLASEESRPASKPSSSPRAAPTGAPDAGRKCRIVATTTSAGHTKFTEVCP